MASVHSLSTLSSEPSSQTTNTKKINEPPTTYGAQLGNTVDVFSTQNSAGPQGDYSQPPNNAPTGSQAGIIYSSPPVSRWKYFQYPGFLWTAGKQRPH